MTVIGALGDGKLALFIKGINLDEFPAYVARFPLLVSYNGSQFDVPFLRAHFPAPGSTRRTSTSASSSASLGYKGGLKAVEGRLGLRRDPSIQGVDGFEAVRLWHRYRRGDRSALEKMILYNVTDVANLVELADTAVELKLGRLSFPDREVPRAAGCAAPKLDSRQLAGWTSRHMAAVYT